MLTNMRKRISKLLMQKTVRVVGDKDLVIPVGNLVLLHNHPEGCNKIQDNNKESNLCCNQTSRSSKLHSFFSLLAGPERILRRFYIFAEEPCKSIITAIEPCSPVFKEAQPRPSRHTHTQRHRERESFYSQSNWNLNFVVHNVFLLSVIYCCNKASFRIVPKQKDLVFSPGYPSHQK